MVAQYYWACFIFFKDMTHALKACKSRGDAHMTSTSDGGGWIKQKWDIIEPRGVGVECVLNIQYQGSK